MAGGAKVQQTGSWGQDEHQLLSSVFAYIDKEPQEVIKVSDLAPFP